ncbi:hypothetical protein BDW66DRAFT_161385 [Aspergillus desertorum]
MGAHSSIFPTTNAIARPEVALPLPPLRSLSSPISEFTFGKYCGCAAYPEHPALGTTGGTKSLAIIRTPHRPYAHMLSTFPGDTFTQLSREEGSALRQHGQLPYGRPTEWGDQSPTRLLKNPGSFSLKHSLLFKSKQEPKTSKPGSLVALTEAFEEPHSQVSISRESLLVSAVEGALELPAETTPRQTSEKGENQPSTASTIRPVSGGWPLLNQTECCKALFPVFENHYEVSGLNGFLIRGGSISPQTPGMVPDLPVPPPPCAYPPNRFRLSKNDSFRYSSASLETADSSILDDSRRTSANIDGSLTSLGLPPCPKFMPFSANDVEKEDDRRSFAANAAPSIFRRNSPARKGQRVDERTPPRRSLTAFPSPRRSESLSARESLDNTSIPYLDLGHIPSLNTRNGNSGLLSHSGHMQRHSMHSSPSRNNDPFYSGTDALYSLTYSPHTTGRRGNGEQSSGPPLASAMKSSGHPKGYRRQNCVRISIHPPIIFGEPAFSPMVEEPEEVEELNIRRSDISDLPASNISRDSSCSAMSTANRNSSQSTQSDRPVSRITEVPTGTPINSFGSPATKKRNLPQETACVKEKVLSGIVASLPTIKAKDSLSQTSLPERNPHIWKVPYQASPITLENTLTPDSPRRPAVMGPRNQPKPARNSYQSLIPSENVTKPPSPPSTHAARNNTLKDTRGKQPPSPPSVKPKRKYRRRATPRPRNSLGSTPSISGTQVSAVVPIWEDRSKSDVQKTPRPSTVFSSMTPNPNEKSDASLRNQTDRITSIFSSQDSKHGSTPRSLYDGDGVLKEQ